MKGAHTPDLEAGGGGLGGGGKGDGGLGGGGKGDGGLGGGLGGCCMHCVVSLGAPLTNQATASPGEPLTAMVAVTAYKSTLIASTVPKLVK